VRVSYLNAGGKAREETFLLLAACGLGVVLLIKCGRTVVAWDRMGAVTLGGEWGEGRWL